MFLLDLIDDQSLIIIQTVFEIIIACIFIVTLPVYNKHYLKVFKHGFILRGIGFLLIGTRGYTPLWLTVFVANVILQAGFFINTYAFLLMINKKITKKYFIAFNGINLVLFIYYTFINPDVGARIVVYSGIQIIPVMYLIIHYSKSLEDSKDRIKLVIAGLYSGILLINLLRLFQVFTSEKITHLFRNDWVLKVVLLYTLLFSFLRVYMIFIFVAKEYQDELKNVNTQLEQLSYMDHLTGIHNNRSIMNILYNELERGMRYHHSITIALIDMDSFKLINDTYGHIVGDAVLKSVSSIFAGSIRNSDAVGRYGGEEFLIIMPETESDQAKLLLERIKETINKLRWEEAVDLNVSFSAGIYTVNHASEVVSTREIIGEADKILYAAKRKGKDRIEVSI